MVSPWRWGFAWKIFRFSARRDPSLIALRLCAGLATDAATRFTPILMAVDIFLLVNLGSKVDY